MMDPFERYVASLRLFLPRVDRDDIVRELRDEYRSQVADREESRGRALTDEERASIVRHFGHPLVTAARYWQQQQLIGPALFPFYWPSIGAVLAVNLLVHATAAGVALGLRRSPLEAATIAGDFWPSAFMLVGVVTVVFAFIERCVLHANPAAVRDARRAAMRASAIAHRAIDSVAPAIATARAVTRPLDAGRSPSRVGQPDSEPEPPGWSGLIVSAVFAAWWLLALRVPWLMFLNGSEHLRWAPAMDRIYPVIAIAVAAFTAAEWLRRTPLRHSALLRLLAAASVVLDALFLMLIITSDYHWVMWQGASIGGREIEIVSIVNVVFTAVMLIVAFGVATRWLKWVGRRFSTNGPHAAVA